MNGKGSSPRNCFSQQFRENHDHIFRKRRPKCRLKQVFRIVSDDDGHWYVIKADEIQIFSRWVEAMNGRRHMPADFSPRQIDGPESIRFCDFWEDSA